MIRFPITQKTLDEDLFRDPNLIATLQFHLRGSDTNPVEARKAAIKGQLIAVLKRCLNERIALEEFLSENGLIEFSAGVYAIDWAQLYYSTVERELAFRKRPLWQRLWAALRGR
tara:strand:- start:92 stop:433 length:342 start_codon:yes stop_codon:yes gene_type:complete